MLQTCLNFFPSLNGITPISIDYHFLLYIVFWFQLLLGKKKIIARNVLNKNASSEHIM